MEVELAWPSHHQRSVNPEVRSSLTFQQCELPGIFLMWRKGEGKNWHLNGGTRGRTGPNERGKPPFEFCFRQQNLLQESTNNAQSYEHFTQKKNSSMSNWAYNLLKVYSGLGMPCLACSNILASLPCLATFMFDEGQSAHEDSPHELRPWKIYIVSNSWVGIIAFRWVHLKTIASLLAFHVNTKRTGMKWTRYWWSFSNGPPYFRCLKWKRSKLWNEANRLKVELSEGSYRKVLSLNWDRVIVS